ncbi:hypothetical protein ACIQUQ_04060 [Streptomyces sp. NPDC101118]|uniref:hypothetical protein n=1 Tax=Streptomyces sp. NPDC101118 TaxID=3366109 RepID=UPI00381E4520
MTTTRLADRFAEARARGFVGRSAETVVFERILASGLGAVVHVHGPAGIGKTTLLHRFAWLAGRAGRPVVSAGGADAEGRRVGPGTVVVVDAEGAEALAERLLEEVPADTVLVLAGREAPPLAWRTDPAWQGLLHALRLGPLPPEESRELLRRRGVPDDEHGRALEFAHGHPLALALIADVRAQRPGKDPSPGQPAWVVTTLLEALLDAVPSPAHRAALEASAQVLVTSEPLLAALTGVPDARDLFDWLCTLSITEYGSRGIHPHDLARSVLDAELRWRHPGRRAELRRRAGAYYQQLFTDGDRARQRTVLADFAYLHRDSPLVGPLLAPVTGGAAGAARLDALSIAPTREADLPAVLAMAEAHEGADSARLLARWWGHPAASWGTVSADGEGPVGFYLLLTLGDAGPAEAAGPGHAGDPAVRAARGWLAGAGALRAGERALLVRSWLARDGYQDVSPVQTLITLRLTHHYLTDQRPAVTLLPFADAGFWAAGCAYTDFRRVPEADFAVGGRGYGMFVHDWRVTPPLAWLGLLTERESAPDPLAVSPPATPVPLRVLDHDAFAEGVREALRGLGRAGGLRDCVLLRSRLVADRAGTEAGPDERAAALAGVLREAAAELEAAPRDRRAYRALHHTYLQPAGTQQRAADLLRLPMSTYRRHLAAGVERLTERLWERELES